MTSACFAPSSSVRALEIDGEITLFNSETRVALVLNDTASEVWRLLDGVRTVEEIVQSLRGRYAATDAVVRGGVEDAVATLRQHQVLVSVRG